MGRIAFPQLDALARARAASRAEGAAVERSLRLSVVEGVFASTMVGASESWFGAFAVALGHKNLDLALIATVPLLFGAVAQLFARALVDLLGGRKRFVVAVAVGQALVHGGLIAVALTAETRLLPLLVVNVLYWACGMAMVPVWNAWMGSLTARVDRGRYFARRAAVAQLGMLGAYVASGLALEHGRDSGALLAVYAAVAAVAGAARALSAFTFSRQTDPPDPPPVQDRGGVGERRFLAEGFFARMRAAVRTSTWGVVFYIVAFQLGANVAIPFFLPYMLHELKLDFVQLMELNACAIVIKPVILPLWAHAAKRFGWRPLLVAASLGTGVVAFGWAYATSMPALFAVQALSGVAWAGIELAVLQLLFASSVERYRVSFFALSTSLTAVAQVTGSLCGAALLSVVADRYTTVFVVSAALRALAVVWLIIPATVLARRDPE